MCVSFSGHAKKEGGDGTGTWKEPSPPYAPLLARLCGNLFIETLGQLGLCGRCCSEVVIDQVDLIELGHLVVGLGIRVGQNLVRSNGLAKVLKASAEIAQSMYFLAASECFEFFTKATPPIS